MPQTEGTLTVDPDEPLPLGKVALLGLQHVLSMDVYVAPSESCPICVPQTGEGKTASRFSSLSSFQFERTSFNQ